MSLDETLDSNQMSATVQPHGLGNRGGVITALVAVVLAALAFAVSLGLPIRNNSVSLYEAPSDLAAFIEKIQASTVTVECGDTQGSGWVIDLGGPGPDADQESIDLDREYPTEVVTNHHVIEECTANDSTVSVTSMSETFDAIVYSWDEENDLALIGIRQSPPALELSDEPSPGWWAMSLGTPYGLAGTVSIGNIMNVASGDVISTAPINSGNSGGPLVNSRGEVIGTNAWVRIGDDHPQDWNVAVGLNKLCAEIVDCAGKPYWPKDGKK